MVVCMPVGNVCDTGREPNIEIVQFCYFCWMSGNKYKRFLLKMPIALVFLFMVLAFIPAHKYYFSLSEVRVDTQKKTLNVSCRMFTDDIQTALDNIYHKKIDLANSKENKEVQNLVNKYVTDHFKITVAGKPLKLSFVGFENEDDATWCYLEAPQFSQKGKITIIDDLLFNLFPDQTNIIQFYWDKINKSQKLINPEKEAMFEF